MLGSWEGRKEEALSEKESESVYMGLLGQEKKLKSINQIQLLDYSVCLLIWLFIGNFDFNSQGSTISQLKCPITYFQKQTAEVAGRQRRTKRSHSMIHPALVSPLVQEGPCRFLHYPRNPFDLRRWPQEANLSQITVNDFHLKALWCFEACLVKSSPAPSFSKYPFQLFTE